jgi:hypothetical protein
VKGFGRCRVQLSLQQDGCDHIGCCITEPVLPGWRRLPTARTGAIIVLAPGLWRPGTIAGGDAPVGRPCFAAPKATAPSLGRHRVGDASTHIPDSSFRRPCDNSGERSGFRASPYCD